MPKVLLTETFSMELGGNYKHLCFNFRKKFINLLSKWLIIYLT